jgi:hypothetical protein
VGYLLLLWGTARCSAGAHRSWDGDCPSSWGSFTQSGCQFTSTLKTYLGPLGSILRFGSAARVCVCRQLWPVLLL